MKNKEKIEIEIIYVDQDRIFREHHEFSEPTQLREIRKLSSGEMKKFWAEEGSVAIDNSVVKDDLIIRKSTRVIVLRPLAIEPKELRRKRAKLAEKP